MAGVIGNREYNLRRVPVLFNGQLLSGAADGDFVTVSSASPSYNNTAGALGEQAVARNNDESGTVTIRIFQGARNVIRIIESAIALAKTAGLQDGVFISIEINDLNGGEHLIMAQCWPTDQPDRNFGQEQQSRDYVFGFAELVSLPR